MARKIGVQEYIDMYAAETEAWRKHQLTKQLRQEYSRQRDIAVKRIKRAQAKGDLLNEPMPPKLSEVSDMVQLVKSKVAVEKFNASKKSTVKGREEIREKSIESLQELGYDVNKETDKAFTAFMEVWRKKYEQETPDGKKQLVDSDTAAEAFDNIFEVDANGNRKHKLSTNARTLSRYFNDYLRAQGKGDQIVYL